MLLTAKGCDCIIIPSKQDARMYFPHGGNERIEGREQIEDTLYMQ